MILEDVVFRKIQNIFKLEIKVKKGSQHNHRQLVGNFRSIRTVRVVYHLPKICGLFRRARLDSSYNMKLVRNSRNL